MRAREIPPTARPEPLVGERLDLSPPGKYVQPEKLSPVQSQALLAEFEQRYPFRLDPFQRDAIRLFVQGDSVMVAAPTGTGKTVVAEFGVFDSFRRGHRVMYTTPIKALSNQKFRDLREQYGSRVGLLTGDIIENRNGQIMVMTTEVLRNMLLQTPEELDDVACVIFDEVHYLADPERGTTWEEAIILAPKHAQFICLSATVTNADEIAAWIGLTHRPIRLITHLERSVPLSLYYYLDGALHLTIDAQGRQVADFGKIGGEMKRRGRPQTWPASWEDRAAPRQRPEPTPPEILTSLQDADLLPAIFFLFSRRDCEAAAEVCTMMHLRAVRDPENVRRIHEITQSYLQRLTPADQQLEQVKTIVRLAHRGMGFHHAGLLPILKQLVEELFSAGLMGVVFATDTLALGINMPARTVVVGRMSKFDGVSRRPLIPNEFQQMAGRAGRRGIDQQGHVVIPYSPWVGFRNAIAIATGPLRPVESGFALRYNTVLNLWSPPSGHRVLQVLRSSLMQFQLQREVRDLAETVQRCQDAIDEVTRGCLIGLPEGEQLLREYDELGHSLTALRKQEQQLRRQRQQIHERMAETPWTRPTRESLRRLFRTAAPGTVVHSSRSGWGILVNRQAGGIGLFLFGDRVERLDSYQEIDYHPPQPVVITLPEALLELAQPVADVTVVISSAQRDEIAARLRQAALPDLDVWAARHKDERSALFAPELARTEAELSRVATRLHNEKQREQEHPCHACPVRQEHRQNLQQAAALLRDKEEAEAALNRRVQAEQRRAESLLRGIVNVLHQFGYLQRGEETDKASRLANIFDTNGLMISEMVASGRLEQFAPRDLAEIFSWFAYDRDFEFGNRHLLPAQLVGFRRYLDDLQQKIFLTERRQGVDLTNGYNLYFYGMMLAWCRGASLAEVLDKADISEGDLVMTFTKTLDLMRQVEEMLATVAPDDPLRSRLQKAAALVRRGIIEQAYTMGFAAEPEAAGDSVEDESASPPPAGLGAFVPPVTTTEAGDR